MTYYSNKQFGLDPNKAVLQNQSAPVHFTKYLVLLDQNSKMQRVNSDVLCFKQMIKLLVNYADLFSWQHNHRSCNRGQGQSFGIDSIPSKTQVKHDSQHKKDSFFIVHV